MLKNIKSKQLLKKLQVKNHKLGDAFLILDDTIHQYDMSYDIIETAESIACCYLNYSINLYPCNDDDDLSSEQIKELMALMYQKICKTNPDSMLDSSIKYIMENKDVIYDVLAYDENDLNKFLNAMEEIKKFYIKNNKNKYAEKLNRFTNKLRKIPVKQLTMIKEVMREYMFYVDKDLFGMQSNDCGTVGTTVDSYMISLNKEYAKYDYAACIERNKTDKPNSAKIAILFKCNPKSNIVSIDFKMYRSQYVSENCISYGKFVGDLGNIKVDISDENKMQTDICNELNKHMARLLDFLKEHPEADSNVKINEVPIIYGKI